MRPRSRLSSRLVFALAIVLSGFAACDEDPTAPDLRDVLAAKGGNGGGGNGGGGSDPTVDDTDPASAPQDTTLNVRVFGSNFDDGSDVAFLLDGRATTKVKTNSTRFISSNELEANITIAIDAQPDRYDVQVQTSRGKKGVGIELFTITDKFGGIHLEIALRDDPTDGLQSDGLTGLSYCVPGVPCYEEGQDFVAAHLNGANGHLMFSVQVPLKETQIRRVRVLGDLIVGRRIYTNDNQDSQGQSLDLRAMADGTITARFFVERGDSDSEEGHLRYGVNCSGSQFERDDANAIPGERVSVTRTGFTWIIEGVNARLCQTTGRGKNATTTETPVSAPFHMTMVAIPPVQ